VSSCFRTDLTGGGRQSEALDDVEAAKKKPACPAGFFLGCAAL
jgi:hypothetical protein